MTNYIINSEQLTAIADGARHVTGSTEKMTVDEIATNLQNHEEGESELPYEFLNDDYSGDVVTDKITTVAPYAFTSTFAQEEMTGYTYEGNRVFGTVDLPNCTKVDANAFFRSKIENELNLPALTEASQYAFYFAQFGSLISLELPALTKAGECAFCFAQLDSLKSLELPALETADLNVFLDADLSGLTELNLPALKTAKSLFQGTNLSNIIKISLPLLEDISYGNFFRMAQLQSATDLNLIMPLVTILGSYTFYNAKLGGITEEKMNEYLCRTDLTSEKTDGKISDHIFYDIETQVNKFKCKWKNIGECFFGHLYNADGTDKEAVKFWISKDTTIPAAYSNDGIFYSYSNSNVSIDIYTDAESKPDNWGNYFNYITYNTQATVHYGISESEFDAL